MDEPLTPWGHSVVAHYLLGWCADCPGRDLADEAIAWRERAMALPDVRREIDRQQDAGRR